MLKQEFLSALRAKLNSLPQKEVEERLSFYSEMIDDRMEDGLSETAAVADVGTVDSVFAQILAELPLSALVREKMKPKHRMGAWEILLLVLGSPVWLSLLISAFAVVLSLYVVLWAVVISLWTIPVSLGAGAIAGVLAMPMFCYFGNFYAGLAMLACGLFCAGLAVYAHYACKLFTCLSALVTKYMTVGIKRMLVGKGAGK